MKACYLVSDGISNRFDLRDVPMPEPKAGEVLVRVRASSLNRADVFMGKGAHSRDKLIGTDRPVGQECTGELVHCGEGVQGFAAGERVMGRAKGGFAEFAVMDAREAIRVPAALSWDQAAATPIVFLVTYDMLFSFGRVQPGDWVLITAVTSGVGVASLQTAKAFGACVIGTSGSSAKLDRLKAVGLDVGVATRGGDFVEVAKQATEGKGVNLVVNNIGGSVFAACQQALGYRGRLAQVGYVDNVFDTGISVEQLHTYRQVFYGVSNRFRTPAERAETVRGFVAEVLPKFADGSIKPLIDRTFGYEELPAAKAYMDANAQVGKIVIRMP